MEHDIIYQLGAMSPPKLSPGVFSKFFQDLVWI
jgi:hypothetical protein